MEPCETRDLRQAHEHLRQWGNPADVESQAPRGDTNQGHLMLAGPGFFADLTVKPHEVEGLPPDPEPDQTASDDSIRAALELSEFSKLAEDQSPVYADLPDTSAKWVPLEAERSGLINASRVYGLPLPRGQRALVWFKTTIHSSNAQQKHASFGWVREAFVFVNGKLVYADKNLYQPPAARKAAGWPPVARKRLLDAALQGR